MISPTTAPLFYAADGAFRAQVSSQLQQQRRAGLESRCLTQRRHVGVKHAGQVAEAL